ncbi:MAG: oligosaccharide flippase family protein [Planctomycetes bacterium]|nr:oligosaccharide flippase family protein [Planctomycetota bacterium]
MLKKLFSSQLRINMASGVLCTVINVIAMMVGYPVYLHYLGYEKYGVWLVLATVLSFARLGDLGIGQAITKLVAEEHGRGDIEGIQKYVTTALALLCLSGSVTLMAVLVFKTQIIGVFKLGEENAGMALWLLPYIGVLSIYVFIIQALNATLSGLGRMDLANYIQSIGRIVSVIVATILLHIGHGIESLLIGNILSYVFIHIVSLIYIRRIAHIRFLRIGNLDVQCGKRILHFGSGIFGGTIISMLGSPFHKLMLSRYAGVATIPIYEIAFRGSMQFRGLIEVGFRALMPEISRISANMTKSARDRILQLYRRAMKLILFAGVPMYGAILIFATPLLKIWLREQFVYGIPFAFRLMLVATFVSLLGVPSYYLLLGMGRIRAVFTARCITWLTSMALVTMIAVNKNYLSVPAVCMSLIISWFLSSTYMIWYFRRAITEIIEKIR